MSTGTYKSETIISNFHKNDPNPAGLHSAHIPLEIFRLAHYKTPMAQSGVLIGIALLAVVCIVAFLIGRQAARGVEQFREEHHARFKGREGR